MRSSPWSRRAAGAALVSALAAGGVLVAVATGATAPAGAPTTAPVTTAATTTIQPTSWAGIDARRPNATITTGDAVVGAWRDPAGRLHQSKAYYTFDLRPFRGTDVQVAEFFVSELDVADCAKPRATQLWHAKPLARPTWSRQPNELTRLPGPGALGCPSSRVEWDASTVVRAAVAAGKDTVMLALRIAENRQDKPAFGRTYATDPGLTVSYNSPPDVPTDLRTGALEHPCSTPDLFVGDNPLSVRGDVTDPDGQFDLSVRIAFWAVDDPAAREEVVTFATNGFQAEFPATLLQDGETVAWQARGEDGDGAVSAWSETCELTVDRTRPGAVPTVESADYPENGGPPGNGGDGVPGEFTFTANGVADVAGFVWSGTGVPPGSADADRPGGSATVAITPNRDGPADLRVASVDRAGNRSDERTYRLWVRATAPLVSVAAGQVGAPVTATFTARQDGAATFTYRVDDGAEASVPVGGDGTATVEVDVPPGEPYFHRLTVWTTDGAGRLSGQGEEFFEIDPARPQVEVSPGQVLLGESTEITFRPAMDGVVSYTYWIDSGEQTVVPAAADGTARVSHTWTEGGFHQVTAFSTNAAGISSGAGGAGVFVESGTPEVTSEQYPQSGQHGGPGIAGTFRFSSPLPGVTEYRYTLWGEVERTVAAGPDGTASVELTPTTPSLNQLDVYAVTGAGLTSGVATYTFYVDGLAPLVTGPAAPVPAGSAAEFHLTAQLPGTTEFGYRVPGGEPQVVPATAGEATVSITATDDTGWGEGQLFVLSRTAAGHSSAEQSTTYQVTG